MAGKEELLEMYEDLPWDEQHGLILDLFPRVVRGLTVTEIGELAEELAQRDYDALK